jgi:hypothetical protein
LAALVLAGACDDNPEVKSGTWGGLGIQVDVTSSGAPVMLCCNESAGRIDEALVPDDAGEFFARGTVYGFRADYQGTVSGETMRLRITSYPPTSPEGFVILSVTGNPTHNLTYGVSFIEKQGSWGCVCPPPCVGCPP